MEILLYAVLTLPALLTIKLIIWPKKKEEVFEKTSDIGFLKPAIIAFLYFFITNAALIVAPSGMVSVNNLFGSDIPNLMTGLFKEYSLYMAYLFGTLGFTWAIFILNLKTKKYQLLHKSIRFCLINFSVALLFILLFKVPLISSTAIQIAILYALILLLIRLIIVLKTNERTDIPKAMKSQFIPMMLIFIIVPSLVHSAGKGIALAVYQANQFAVDGDPYHGPYDINCLSPKQISSIKVDIRPCWWSSFYENKPQPEVLMLHQALLNGNISSALQFLEWSQNRVGKSDIEDHIELIGKISKAIDHKAEHSEKTFGHPNRAASIVRLWKTNKGKILNQHLAVVFSNIKHTSNEYSDAINTIIEQKLKNIE